MRLEKQYQHVSEHVDELARSCRGWPELGHNSQGNRGKQRARRKRSQGDEPSPGNESSQLLFDERLREKKQAEQTLH